MAAPGNPQGSRAGLVTAVVIFVILFVTATIFAIYFGTNYQKELQATNEEKQKAATILNPASLRNEDVLNYIEQAKAHKPDAAWDVLLREKTALSKLIAGQALPTSKVQLAAHDTLAYASDKVKTQANVSSDLNTTIRSLADAVVAAGAERDQAKAAAASSADAATHATAERDAMLKDKDAKIAEANDARDKAVEEIEAWRKAKGGDIDQIKAAADANAKQYQTAAEKDQADKQKLTAKTAELNKLVEGLERRLSALRVNPKEAIVQQADGHIIRIPSHDTVFIDIGQQQQVTPGLTFEVYDKNKGIPALGDGLRDTEMPVGKASIEVVHVLPGSSECRVVRHSLGQTLTEGDIIVNLIFDPKAKYNFVVYGDFDLAQTGFTNAADIDVVKRLVTQWGAKLQGGVNVDTDFLVMGKEPEVPVLSKDDEQDQIKVKQRDDKQAALDAYLDVRSKAIALGVPILNQNRFLYFIGYYDTAAR